MNKPVRLEKLFIKTDLTDEMSHEERTKAIVYSCCWQNEGSACAMGWLLALVRLGVANVRWACAAPRLATHREQMPIDANGTGVVVVQAQTLNFI